MDNPYPINPTPANGRADGWFCPDCHSLNRAGTTRCYSCRANTPLVASAAPASWNKGLVGILLVMTLVFAGLGGSVVFGRTTATPPKPTDSPIGLIAIVSDGSTLPTGGGPEASDSATPSAAIPSMSTSEVTFIPQPTATPTPAATAGPTSRTTAVPTSATTEAPTDPTDDTVALPKFSYPVAGATVKYFSIEGDTPYALLQADEAASSKACNLKDSRACFLPGYRWSFVGQTDVTSGVCVVKSVDLTASYTIILPNWTSPARVPAVLVAWWKLVLDHIAWHESQHLAIAQEYAPKVKAALQNTSCSGFAAASRAIRDDIDAAQDVFDAQQKAINWQYPPYSGTWK
jgi:predicted secreted Zn-dependent protease